MNYALEKKRKHGRIAVSIARWSLAILAVVLLYPQPGLTQIQAVPEGSENSVGVVLRWTAPGDDHYVGQASTYQIRYHTASLGPLDTEQEWAAATAATNLPTPSPAGQTDSVVVRGLAEGALYYFALRSLDEALNQSEISNSPLMTAEQIACCEGQVGDANGQGGDVPTIGDVTRLIDHLFINGAPIWCPAEADINQSGGLDPQQGQGGDITVGDITLLIDHLFVSEQPLAPCL